MLKIILLIIKFDLNQLLKDHCLSYSTKWPTIDIPKKKLSVG